MTSEQAHFTAWAQRQGINLKDKEDCIDWWNCWVDGFNTSLRLYATWKDGNQQVGTFQRSLKDCLLDEEKVENLPTEEI